MHPVQYKFDSGPGHSMIREDVLETERLQLIREANRPSLRSAINWKVGIVEAVLLHVRMGDAHNRVVLGIV